MQQHIASPRFDLPPALREAVSIAARQQGLTPGQYVAAALRQALTGPVCRRRTGHEAEEIAAIFAGAADWLDLQRRLRARGLVIRRGVEGELHLHSWPAGVRLLPVEALGQSAPSLCLRFRAPFPDMPDGRSAWRTNAAGHM